VRSKFIEAEVQDGRVASSSILTKVAHERQNSSLAEFMNEFDFKVSMVILD
jgi:hypothetical protein